MILLPYVMKEVRSWRIQDGDPEGLLMWFDPSFEVPMLGVLPPEQREDDAGCAEFQMRMELSSEREVVPCEGGAGRVSEVDLESQEDPPPGFLDSLWEGFEDGES